MRVEWFVARVRRYRGARAGRSLAVDDAREVSSDLRRTARAESGGARGRGETAAGPPSAAMRPRGGLAKTLDLHDLRRFLVLHLRHFVLELLQELLDLVVQLLVLVLGQLARLVQRVGVLVHVAAAVAHRDARFLAQLLHLGRVLLAL